MRRSAHVAHVLVISDRAARGEREDGTSAGLIEVVEEAGLLLSDPAVTIVPDERDRIARELRRLISDPGIALVLTTGGTGPAPRDVTPEATREVLERELPGFGELMRAVSLRKTALAAGSRALAGTVAGTLVINLPGSPGGARECFQAVSRAARHVLDLIGGGLGDCGPARSAEESRPGPAP